MYMNKANPMVVGLNLRNTLAEQNNQCVECQKEIDPDKEMVYFRMDQAIHLYEVYCRKCGLVQQEKDKKRGKKIDHEQ